MSCFGIIITVSDHVNNGFNRNIIWTQEVLLYMTMQNSSAVHVNVGSHKPGGAG